VLKTVPIWLPCVWNTGSLGFDAFDFVHDLMRDWRGAHRVVVGRPEGKIPLGRRRWDGNFKMDLDRCTENF
jgi:hypothetical protein